MGVDAGGAEGEFVHLELAHEDCSGFGEAFGYGGVIAGYEVAEYLRADGGSDALGVVEVFEADGDAVEGAPVISGGYLALGGVRLFERFIG